MTAAIGGGARVFDLSKYRRMMRFPLVNEVEAYWEGLRDGRPLPARSEVDPRGLERALEHAFILERVAPGVARFRLAGGHLHDLMGMDVRGMPLSALFTAEARPELALRIEALFDAPQTVRLTVSGERGIGKPALAGEMLLLPLRDDRGTVSRALGCLVTEGRMGRAPRRFAIVSALTRALAGAPRPALSDPGAEAGTAGTVAPGFAEPAAGFAAAGPDRRPSRPSLRLVKSGD